MTSSTRSLQLSFRGAPESGHTSSDGKSAAYPKSPPLLRLGTLAALFSREPSRVTFRMNGYPQVGLDNLRAIVGNRVRRRDFIAILGGGAAACPLAVRAQQPLRRIAVLMAQAADDPVSQPRAAAFVDRLQELGWNEGKNLSIDLRWDTQDPDLRRKDIAEIVAFSPDAILATGSFTVGPLLQQTRAIPIVFVLVPDPVGSGFVNGLAHPGGNATGFLQFEYSLGGKWLELLKEIAPRVSRVAVLRDQSLTAGVAQFAAVESVAHSLRVELVPVNAQDAAEIERGIDTFARSAGDGLIVTSGPRMTVHRDLIVALASRFKLPAVYYERLMAAAGGLLSYGPDFVDQYRRAAEYVDRILRGEKPADLPVQAPTKYQLVINLKTAKALGLGVPQSLLARADEVIE
jgi:ABC-type uncharacterized transport system substrate-binding protein